MAENLDDLVNRIRSNSKEENKKLAEEMRNNLSDEQAQSLNKLISNKELMRKLLSSEEAKNIINKLGGDNNGHK